MKFKKNSQGIGHGIGTLVGRTCKVLCWPCSVLRNAMGKRKDKRQSAFPVTKIRAMINEELTRLMGSTERLTAEELEHRFRVMTETMQALQERLDRMVAEGHISETDVLKTMDSLGTADSLTGEEKMVLVHIFRQNVALQKPELVGIASGSGI